MIKNDRQYHVTRGQLDRFEGLLRELETRPVDPKQHPRMREIERASVQAQVRELREQLEEYEALRDGRAPVSNGHTLDELPTLLVRARIARKLTQRDLAERLGMKEQQIQRYEATDYAGASYSRLVEVAEALNLRLPPMAPEEAQLSVQAITKRLKGAGIDPAFVRKRLAPAPAATTGKSATGAVSLLMRLGRVFGLEPDAIWGDTVIQFKAPERLAFGFKLPSNVKRETLMAYTQYARYLADCVAQTASGLERRPLPSDWRGVRAAIEAAHNEVSFEATVRYLWDVGIPVLPLADPGAFHGAYFRIHGRDVVVIKQRQRSPARWLFDLLHETRHVITNTDEGDVAMLDGDDSPADSTAENAANKFAGDVLLQGRAEEIAQEAATAAGGYIPRLKSVVPRVAAHHNVPVDALANYLAYRLADSGTPWWGAAQNLQASEPDPWAIARDILLERADFDRLAPLDRSLLLQALEA